MLTPRQQLFAAGIVVAAAASWWTIGSRSSGEQAAPAVKFDLAKAKYYGAGFCAECHLKPTPRRKSSLNFVLLNEFTTWRARDRHSLAYLVLLGERGQQIGTILKTDVTKAEAGCLNCHGMPLPKDRQLDPRHYLLANGVQCETCHGPAEHWFTDHILESWRELTPEQKAERGMYDIRDPRRRAELCVSCHVGNAAEGKVVTHAMFAAGHPPLPGFEVATFSENMPPHWYKRKDVPWLKETQSSKIRDEYHFDTAEFEQTQLVMATSFVTPRQIMLLAASRAGEVPQETAAAWPATWALRYPLSDASRRWPELANDKDAKLPQDLPAYWPEVAMAHSDCFACHHDLKVPSWRQARGYHGRPGRPPFPAWPSALIDSHVYPREETGNLTREYRRELSPLDKALDAQPFGRPTTIHKVTSELATWTDGKIKANDLAKVKLQSAEVDQLLRQLCTLGPNEILDYDSARQVAWAVKVIYPEANLDAAAKAKMDKILSSLDKELNLDQYGIKIKRWTLMNKLMGKEDYTEQQLADRLEQIPDEEVIKILTTNVKESKSSDALLNISNKDLSTTLRDRSRYNPATFKEQLKALAKLLPGK